MNDGTGPVKTIGRALEIAVSSDRVVLANTGQSYRESVSLVGSRHGGAHARPLTIVGNGASVSVLEQAGVARADLFLAVTNRDEVNILGCLDRPTSGSYRLDGRDLSQSSADERGRDSVSLSRNFQNLEGRTQ